ncbi:MAG: iron complex outermembrane receptor protein, partial [Gammaproteobacteria bacterium]
FSASPLLGLPIGISVFQNGVRINEPLGDGVNWDVLPESAIHSLNLIGGANPLFGLNTLGGALSIKMKDGFNFTGHAGEASGGSWDRVSTTIESGGNDGTFGYYANVHYFEEQGWRQQSESEALNFYTALSWRGVGSEANISFQYADTDLTGNGPAPRGLLSRGRDLIFTAPDITENQLHALTLDVAHDFSDELTLNANGFYREIETSAFNGDASGFSECRLSNATFLLDELDEEGLELLGLDEAALCQSNSLGAADPDDLETRLNTLAGASDAFNIEDLTTSLSGTGELEDEAINNRSERTQQAFGTDAQAVLLRSLFSRENYFVAGFSFYRGEADFDADVELARLDPTTRSTAQLGVGSFVDALATSVKTRSNTWSVYFLDNFALSDDVTLTVGGRYNDTHTRLRDRSGERRELNGDHDFRRFNPMIGVTFDAAQWVNVYASYSQSSRAPTPIELACNDGVFEIARQIAIEDGEDPNDIDFECRLPNAFLADPPLEQVVAKGFEGGFRGQLADIDYRIGYFHTVNNDDIIFQSTGRNTGLFANVDKTQRSGLEVAFAGELGTFEWFTTYSYIEATFESRFDVLSPNHPAADSNGEVRVDPGSRIPGIPRHQLKVGGDIALKHSIKLGFDLLYNSDQVLRGDEANLLDTVEGYAIANVRIVYTITQHAELFARVTNLFDTDYENFGLVGEDPSDVLPTLTDPTPIFLGPGAPRGAWIGLRVRF